MLTGILYSVISPACFLIPAVRQDAGGFLLARRFQALVQYGEGPHVTAMTLLPVVIWVLDEAASAKKWIFVPLASIALAALVLTNWTGTVGLSMALTAYFLSKLGASKAGGDRPLHWPTLLGIAAIACMLASPWIPPSLVRTVRESSANMEIVMPGSRKLLVLIPLAFAVAGFHFAFERLHVNRWFRFFLYFTVITVMIAGGELWFGWRVIPLAQRFHLEMEMAVVGAVSYAVLHSASWLPRWGRIVALCVLILFCAAQVRRYRGYARDLAQSIDFTTTVEYKMAQWFATNMDGQRVFAPGTVSIWMNLYSDVPQFDGCCDQTVRDEEHRIAKYIVYSGDGAGARAGEIATLWLKAYGIAAVGVAATGSSQLPQPYGYPHQFDGVLPEAWRDGESVVYRVPQPPYSLAHVMDRSAAVLRAPVNGIDVEPLLPLVAALDAPTSPPATFRWLNQHEAEITAQTGPNQVLFIQETYDPGWHAIEDRVELSMAPDALGLITLYPDHAGPHTIRLIYTEGLEDKLARTVRILGLVLLGLWTILAWRNRLGRPARLLINGQ